jgi:hypothetical protein
MKTYLTERKAAHVGSESLHYFVCKYYEAAEECLEHMDLSPDDREHAERALYDLYAASKAVRAMMKEARL